MKILELPLSLINSILGRLFGFHLHAHFLRQTTQPEQPCQYLREEPRLSHALARLKNFGIEIGSLIDVGASDGIWSKEFAKYFPGKHHLLLDANRIHQAKLKQVCAHNSKWQYVMTAVGGEEGTLYFDDSDPLGGHLSTRPLTANYSPCPVTTIDRLVIDRALPGPYMIKLDTHGVELPILSGAKETLQKTNVLVIEAYNFTFGTPAVPFWELCDHMFRLGYRPLDIFDILFRELDAALWQFDLLFVRSDLPLFSDHRFFIAGRH